MTRVSARAATGMNRAVTEGGDRLAPQGPASPGTGEPAGRVRPRANRGWLWLLLLPFAALLVPPLYAHESPHLWGIPFFYWYQAVWLLITAGITMFVAARMRS